MAKVKKGQKKSQKEEKNSNKKVKAAEPVKETKKGKSTKAEAQATKATKAEKPVKAEKPAKAEKATGKKVAKSDNKAMYVHTDGKLYVINWDTETDKTVKANSEVHSNSPLKKSRIYKLNEKSLKEHNALRDKIVELEAKAVALLDKAGLHF